MDLSSIFQKPIERSIDGVIKADDDRTLEVEIDEYVLTNEIEKRLEDFLNSYNHYHGSNGVWISGFFGSGKSHLLKMLAYLLESGPKSHIQSAFLEKSNDNRILRAEIQRAVSIPSKSILFNIDQKADQTSKSELDALLGVFVRVFYEMQGYFGRQGYIAQFESELDERGLYESFRKEFQDLAGIPWDKGRERSILEETNITAAYNIVVNGSGGSSKGILADYRDSYSISIEDFAELVNAYIQKQEPNFRLNFFVDEVGQYIADNVKLMTNLQTIAESLATKCRGQSWLVVTAQEDMNTVVGEMDTQQGNDFSKIQDRFKTRMKLTSQDVAEVIQKRLLAKNELGVGELKHIYEHQANNFKTLFGFTDGTDYRDYKDLNHFIDAYPFIPYQFVLFQSAIQNLSQNNAFEGRHSSVGERSMLAVFQQVAKQIGTYEVGQLATFDLMFEGIRTSLKASIQSSVLRAEGNVEHSFAVRLLKVLFLVKYVKEFKATEHNLAVLMTEQFGQDVGKLRERIQEAIRVLENGTYIQRNGNIVEYLTNEEKDIEQAIKNTDVETSSLIDELGRLVFDRTIKQTKLSGDGTQSYDFSCKQDDQPYRRSGHELAIHLITPFNENANNRHIFISQSMGRDELYVLMPADDQLVRDLKLHKQTEKYLRQNINTAPNENIRGILNSKQYQNNQRYQDIEEQVQRLLVDATYIINGQELELTSGDAQTQIISGFQQLIRTTYTNLKMLPSVLYKDTDIPKYLKPDDSMFAGDTSDMNEAEREILNYITLQKNNGQRTTMKSLTDRFERKPYGWYLAAIQCNLAKLYARGRVEVRQDGNVLEGDDLAKALANTRQHANLILAPEEEFTPSQVRDLKDFFNDFFDRTPSSEEAKELATQTKAELQAALGELSSLYNRVRDYPFLEALKPVIEKLRSVTGKPYAWYLSEFGDDADELLDMKDDVVSPILSFVNGGQRDIYDEAREFLKVQQANLEAIGDQGYDQAVRIRQTLEDPTCFRGDAMRAVKSTMDGLKGQIVETLQQTQSQALDDLETIYNRFAADERFDRLSPIQQDNVVESFRDVKQRVEDSQWIIGINGFVQQFRDNTAPRLLSLVDQWLHEQDAKPSDPKPTPIHYVTRSEIKVDFDKLSLDSETDVNDYLGRLQEAYLQQIRNGKRIQL